MATGDKQRPWERKRDVGATNAARLSTTDDEQADALEDGDEKLERDADDDAIVVEAHDNFRRGMDWENDFRNLYVVDVKFSNADSDNNWQWPENVYQDRVGVNKRPTLTINKTAQHVGLITNDMRQNKPSIKISPVGKEASFQAAQGFEGLVRNIEYMSSAAAIYDGAAESQVEGGIAYWRVNTTYSNDEGLQPDASMFNQEIRIEPIFDQMNVLLDCDIKQRDGSDAMWGFIFDETPRKRFEKDHPNVDVSATTVSVFDEGSNWVRDDYVRIAEYYRIVETKDELILMTDDAGETSTFYRSEVPPDWNKELKSFEKKYKDDKTRYRCRTVKKRSLEWYKIAGCDIVARRKLKGRYVPIVRVVGKERVIEGKLHRAGLVRNLKDAQRMYNYNSSGQVEYGALASKSPWVGAAAAFAGNENAWNNANRQNAAYLTFRHMDADGNSLPEAALPRRPDPPGASPAFLEGMRIASGEMEMTSGQYREQKGQPSNAQSGRAIAERQQQGDTANYHFIDNRALAIRLTGKIIIDLVPHVYDTERVVQILGRDGKQTMMAIQPGAGQAYQESDEVDNQVKAVLDPTVGRYEVEADIGPAYATQRQEAWNAFVQIVVGNPELINDIGDLMFQSADFHLADKIAERIKRKIKGTQPWLLDDDQATPAMQKIQQELEQATQTISELLEKLADSQGKLKSKDQKRDIEAYRAESDRFAKEANTITDLLAMGDERALDQIKKLLEDTMQQMQGTDITDTVDADQSGKKQLEQAEGEEPPHPAARKAPDGEWYVEHQPGKFARVVKEAA